MKTLKSMITMILLVGFVQSCSPDDTVEEQINNQNIEILSTGEEGSIEIDVSKGT